MRGLQAMRVVVAGGATGVGAAVVRRLFEEGSKIVIGDLNAAGADKLASELSVTDPGRAIACEFNMADEQSINALIQRSVDEFGGIDGLINMAALVKPEIQWRDVEVARMEMEIWKMTMDVNLIGFGLATKAALPHMVAQKHGAIVNISSGAAWLGLTFVPAYASSKAAVHALTRHTANTYGSEGVRANCVAFGMIATETLRSNVSEDMLEQGAKNSVLGRVGEPEEPAALVCYLLSRDASYVVKRGRFGVAVVVGLTGINRNFLYYVAKPGNFLVVKWSSSVPGHVEVTLVISQHVSA